MRGATGRFTLVALVAAVALLGCATPAERFERRAAALDLDPISLPGRGFVHRGWSADLRQGGTTLHVYVEHDGTPWASFDRVSPDPDPRTPYALELMARDVGPRLLLGRPCYLAPREAPPCDPLRWTHGRYSSEVVASMAAALHGFLADHPFRQVVLVGYSGGGTLAWLMAARLPETVAVVTIAANLDIDDWARIHGYSRLSDSLDPARSPALSAAVAQLHYVGGRDSNVPPSVVRSFARSHPGATVIEIADFDHRCCWIERWPALLAAALGTR